LDADKRGFSLIEQEKNSQSEKE